MSSEKIEENVEENVQENEDKSKERVCPKCGATLEDDFKICPHCGRRLDNEMIKAHRNELCLLILLSIVSLLFFIGCMTFLGSIRVGSVFAFISGLLALGCIPFGLLEYKDEKDSKKGLINLVSVIIYSVMLFIIGVSWFAASH